MRGQLGWEAGVWGLVLVISGLLIVVAPGHAPLAIAAGLFGAVPLWIRAWRAAGGTTLRGVLVWAAVAIGLGIAAQAVAVVEPLELGRPWTGRVTYVMVLTILASLISILGARTPGGGAWAILMILLVVVLLIPWLEFSGRVQRGPAPSPVRLDSPWTLFYGVLVLSGVMNYLPTRYGPAACILGAGLVAEYLGLTRKDWTNVGLARIWASAAWSLALCSWVIAWQAGRTGKEGTSIERLWFWFRDHWGVVWAIRTADRFNRTAETARWPLRLSWFGLSPSSAADGPEWGSFAAPAESTLRNLIRRFVTSERIDALLEAPSSGPCHSGQSPE